MLADASLFMYVAMSVAVLELRNLVKEGREVVPRREWVAGTITCVGILSFLPFFLSLNLCSSLSPSVSLFLCFSSFFLNR